MVIFIICLVEREILDPIYIHIKQNVKVIYFQNAPHPICKSSMSVSSNGISELSSMFTMRLELRQAQPRNQFKGPLLLMKHIQKFTTIIKRWTC